MHSVLLLKRIFFHKDFEEAKTRKSTVFAFATWNYRKETQGEERMNCDEVLLESVQLSVRLCQLPPHSSSVWRFCWDLCEGPGRGTFISSKEGQSVCCHFRNSKWAWPLLNKTLPYFKTSCWKCLLDKGHAKIRQFVYKGFLMKMRGVFLPELLY